MKPEVERIIHLLNPWLAKAGLWSSELRARIPDPFVPRSVLQDYAKRWQDSDKVHLIVGPRQVGKSTIVWKQLASYQPGSVLYLNCEEALIQELCLSPTLFLDEIKDLLPQVKVLFFEEAQHLKEAGLFLKGLVDHKIGIPILVTGSSSYHLHAKTRESLAGRATRVRVFPLSLQELSPSKESRPSLGSWRQTCSELIELQLRFGSYPAVWLAEQKEDLLYDLIESFVIRDASDLFHIKHLGAFRQLLKLLAWQVGDLVNYSEWGSNIGIDYNTCKHYIDLLQESGIVEVISPYRGGKRAEITATPIIYFLDMGMRNALEGHFTHLDERVDRGKVFENWVFAELKKWLPPDVSIHYWRTKAGAEVDFVLVHGQDLIGIEVKCSRLSEGKIARSSRSFIEAYQPKKFFIINRAFEGKSLVGTTDVIHQRPEAIFDIKF